LQHLELPPREILSVKLFTANPSFHSRVANVVTFVLCWVWTSEKKWLPLTPVTWAWCRLSVLNISFLFWYSSYYQIKESQDNKLNISLNCSYLCYYFGFINNGDMIRSYTSNFHSPSLL
jgi:hypothetical protein